MYIGVEKWASKDTEGPCVQGIDQRLLRVVRVLLNALQIDQWNAMVAVNLTGPVLGCKHAVKTISESGGAGAIINVSSVAGLVGIADVAGYTATKGGLALLTRGLCADLGPLGIQVNTLAPRHVWSVNFFTGHSYARFFPNQQLAVRRVRDRR